MKIANENKKTAGSAPVAAVPLQKVHLELTHPAARKVCVAGSFNNWRPDATEMIPLGGGKWCKDLTLPAGTYEYRLVVDGQWLPDPNASSSVPNPFGEANSLLTVPQRNGAPHLQS